jgi:ABC-type multidrug transport system fused ATPase/permease subunit
LKKTNSINNLNKGDEKPEGLSLEEVDPLIKNRPLDKFVQVQKLWEGNNNFWLNGMLTRGPKRDNKAKYWYWISLSIVEILYFTMIAPYLIAKVSFILFGFKVCLTVATVVFSLITSYKDPGWIPRYAILRSINNGVIPERFSKPCDDNEANLASSDKRFCKTCKIWRPERASHCSVCDCWVEVYDHHWPYLNNWIGQRNYKYFIFFLWCITVNGLTIIASVIIYITSDVTSDTNLAKSGPVHNSTIALMIVIMIWLLAVLFFLLVIILLGFHLYLILKGKTTKEELTKKKDQKTHKCFSWLIVKAPNFKGGNQWLSKVQYELYKQYAKDVKEGKVLPNSDARIMELFIRQRQIEEAQNIKFINLKNNNDKFYKG